MKNRKHILFQAVFPVCLAVILCTSQSFAHRINIFALVEADQIRSASSPKNLPPRTPRSLSWTRLPENSSP